MSSTRTSYFRPLAALVALVAAMAALLIAYNASPARAAAPICTPTGTTTSCTYASTGAEDTFVVPAGVRSVHVVAIGAPGAVGSSGGGAQGPAGRGAEVSGDLTGLTPGDTLYVEVGDAPTGGGTSACYAEYNCIGGFNGGGSSGFYAGGGGGASDVRTQPRTVPLATTDSRLIVAGGGGGSGTSEFCFVSGAGLAGGAGGDAGSDGGDGPTCGTTAGGTGGGAGTQSAGGAGGSPFGQSGSLGQGGNAGNTGGGGGGGYYGGGGGSNRTFDSNSLSPVPGGGGGGGSNLVPTGGTASVPLATTGPSITIRYTTTPSDTTPPTLSVTHTADGTGGWNKTSPVTVNVSASDSGSGLAAEGPTCTDGTAALPLEAGSTADTWTASVSGDSTHDISCSVSDKAGNTATTPDTVKIDTKAPSVSGCSVTPSTLRTSSNNHKLVTVRATAPTVTDPAGGSGQGGFKLLSVTSNQPDSGLARDDVAGDIQGWDLGTADIDGKLRAERYGSTRTYTLTYRGYDLAGNTAECFATVTVPKGG